MKLTSPMLSSAVAIAVTVTSAIVCIAEEPFVPANGFDWNRTISRRPVFTVDYWTGVPATIKEGRPDFSSDLEHLKAYADPVTVRSVQGAFTIAGGQLEGADPGSTGAFAMPDLIKLSDEELRDWGTNLHAQLQPVLSQFRRAGVVTIDTHMFFLLSGSNTAPDWYRQQVPDWSECDLSGKPMNTPCLTHPKLYEVSDRVFQAISFMKKEPVIVGFHLENEPIYGGNILSRYGGNPHTKAAFREYLRETFGTVERLNAISEGAYSSFEDIDLAEDNWLVRVMASRFRSTLLLGRYQAGLAAAAKKHFPDSVVMTRLSRQIPAQNGKQEIWGTEFTHLKDSKVDIVSWSHFPVGHHHALVGELNVMGGLLRGVDKPIGFTEPCIQRYAGSQFASLRPAELQHVIYRGLFYNFRMFNLHSWDRTGAWAPFNEPFGAVYSKHQGTLRMVAQLRSELERSAPFETFGKPVMPPLRLLVSRNARHYPGMAGWPYSVWMNRLTRILNTPKFTSYEILEEQTGDLEAALRDCRGVVVSDASLSQRTRELLSEFVKHGGRLLVFGVPATVDSDYETADASQAYPAHAQRASLADLTAQDIPAAIDCAVAGEHPVFNNLDALKLLRPAQIDLKPNCQVVVQSEQGAPVGAANEQVVYVSGFPIDPAQQQALLENFGRWCDIEPPPIVVSRFENAVVAQKWDVTNQNRDGSAIDSRPFYRANHNERRARWHCSGTARRPSLVGLPSRRGRERRPRRSPDRPAGRQSLPQRVGARTAALRGHPRHARVRILLGRTIPPHHRALHRLGENRRRRPNRRRRLG